MSDKATGFFKHLLYIISCIIIMFPLYFIIVSAFKTKKEYTLNKFLIPSLPTIKNFITALRGHTFFLWMANTILLTVFSVFICLIIASFAAYAFSKMRFYGRDTILNLLISLMIVPPIVLVIPLYYMMNKINFTDNYISVILIYVALLLPFSIFLLTSFFITIPNELMEAASIDGCSGIAILFRIILPLSKPPIITLIVVNSLWVWSELLIALIFLQSDKMKTAMVGITIFQGRYLTNVPVIMAAMVMATIPMLVLYLFGQRYFISGITAGALKG